MSGEASSALAQAKGCVAGGRQDWAALARLLRRSGDPAMLTWLTGELARQRTHEAQAIEDRWMAEMAFEKIHAIHRPAATLVPDYDRPLSARRFERLMPRDERYALVAVVPLWMPVPSAAAIAISVIAMEHGTSLAPWQLGRSGFELTLLPPGYGVPWAVFDFVEEGAFVPVELDPFLDLVPGALSGEPFGDDVYEWLDRLSEDELSERELRHTGSRVGGYRAFNAQYVIEEAVCGQCRAPLWYAVHLASDIFDATFGEGGSLHVMVCPRGCEARAMLDAA